MKLHFAKVSPTENMTVFIFDPVPSHLHGPVAKKIMASNSLYAEQVGFIELPRTLKGREKAVARLQMMGGEFCGNATRALAAYYVANRHIGVRYEGDLAKIDLEVSGLEDVVTCEVALGENGKILSTSSIMPAPLRVTERIIELAERRLPCTEVELPGITHILVEDEEPEVCLFWQIKNALKFEGPALGIIFCNNAAKEMVPLVWVKETGTLIFERGCGSAAVAFGAALAQKKDQSVEVSVRQPGGIITAKVEYFEGKWGQITIAGETQIVAEGFVSVVLD